MANSSFVNGPSSAGVRDGEDVLDALRWAADQIESTSGVRTLAEMSEEEKTALEIRYGCRVLRDNNQPTCPIEA